MRERGVTCADLIGWFAIAVKPGRCLQVVIGAIQPKANAVQLDPELSTAISEWCGRNRGCCTTNELDDIQIVADYFSPVEVIGILKTRNDRAPICDRCLQELAIDGRATIPCS